MGAKAPEKLKLRRQPCNCDICGRAFLNAKALTSHKKFMHKPKTIPIKTVKTVKVTKQPRAAAKKASKPADVNPDGNKMPTIQIVPRSELEEPKKVTPTKKLQFKCPRCVNTFSVYFSAYRHIQKYHCVDSDDKPVQPNSPHLIRPIRVEQCVFCEKWLEPGADHACEGILEHTAERYMCLGCQQTFDNMVLFQHHVKGLHADGAEYYFFSTKDEFTEWKTELENTINVKYVTITKDVKTKETFHCSHQPSMKTDKTLLCPSTVFLTEFKNGYQVTYYKEHIGHNSKETLATKYKKYFINPLIKECDDLPHVDRSDNVFLQFKNIMNGITVSAADVDIRVLNTLLGKALEMTVILNSVAFEEQTALSKTMTDEQITDVLTEVKTYPGKRKVDSVKKDAKRPKPSLENDENSKLDNSLPSKGSKVNNHKVKSDDSVSATPLTRPLSQSPSFNDSYKTFVDQNFTGKPNDRKSNSSTPEPKKSVEKGFKKKVVVKTKIGQFKVKPTLSPKEVNEVKEKTSLSPKQSAPIKAKRSSTMSPRPSKKSPIEKIVEFNVKPDIQYEVKEQENDCNILILKI